MAEHRTRDRSEDADYFAGTRKRRKRRRRSRKARRAAEGETEDAHAPDDALGLYLRQMGAIPLLNRDQELALAKRLELRRRRYRHAALVSWRTLEEVVKVFERVLAEECALDPTIDVVKTLGLSRDEILKRMPHNVKTLRRLIQTADADFRALERASTAVGARPHAPRPLPPAAQGDPCWPRRCRRASTCSTTGWMSWPSRRGRWRTFSTRSTAAAAPPPTASAAPSWSSSCAT